MNKIAIPCTCGCGVLVIVEFDQYGEDPQEFFVEFFTSPDPRISRRQRLATAWRVLRGREPWLHDVNLGPHEMNDMKAFLERTLPKA